MPDINSFLNKNFNKFHIIGMFAGVTLSLLYWFKSGQFSDNPLKKSIVLICVWGLCVGYITFDFIFNAKNRNNRNQNEK